MTQHDELLHAIDAYCRRQGIAASTFGLRAVNDGKFVGRLRQGKRVTTDTLDRVRRFIESGAEPPAKSPAEPGASAAQAQADPAAATFRFYDNRQKYLMFVNTCGEKRAVAERVAMELGHIAPKPPALRLFDAGMGDGTVLTRVMRAMHRRYPTFPFYIVAKEISLEDVRLSLEKMPDRLFEHPATVLVITNLHYTESPWLKPASLAAAATLNWIDVPLAGTSAHEFDEQIADLQPLLSENWQVRYSAKTGNPLYQRPAVLVLYREDHKFLLDPVIPEIGRARADFDIIIASQPYRSRMPAAFKVDKVLAPLSRALAPGGRLLVIQSHGDDPGLEIIRRVWPGEAPFPTDRHELLRALKAKIARSQRELRFNAYADKRSIFRYDMHTLPTEISGHQIGTSTLLAAWNAATYVAQLDDARLEEVISDAHYLEATRDVLAEYDGLWFQDESFVIYRRRS